MNATLTQINTNRTNAKHLRAAGFHAEADAYDATADDLRDEMNELERRRVAAKHAETNPQDEPHAGHAVAGCWCAKCQAHMTAELAAYQGRTAGDEEALGVLMNTASATNQGDIDDALESEHDAVEDWRHCKIAE